MKKLTVLTLSAFGLLLTACTGASTQQSGAKSANEIAPYPAAQSGFVRSVIHLPELKDEKNSKIELIVGKEMLVDCNLHSLLGSVKQEELKGWGYQYFVVNSKVNSGISTMMACPPNYENKLEFVTVNHDLGLLRYNSRLPIVVYAPEGMQVKYKIWSANTKEQSATVE